jgi:hypothetical protein
MLMQEETLLRLSATLRFPGALAGAEESIGGWQEEEVSWSI